MTVLLKEDFQGCFEHLMATAGAPGRHVALKMYVWYHTLTDKYEVTFNHGVEYWGGDLDEAINVFNNLQKRSKNE